MSTKSQELENYFMQNGDNYRSEKINSWKDLIHLQGCSSFKVHVWGSGGNFFFKEIAEYISCVLQKEGFSLETSKTWNSSILDIVIAPHEFMYFDEGKEWSEERKSRSIYFNTEQWHTQWFELSLKAIQFSKKVIDINPNSAKSFLSLGFDSAFAPIFLSPKCDNQLNDLKFIDIQLDNKFYPLQDRKIDLFFIACSNERREKALADLSKHFSGLNTFIHCPNLKGRPILENDPNSINLAQACAIARQSKVLLNIRRDNSLYFEWHRLFLMGINSGCVTITEHSLHNDLIQPSLNLNDTEADYLECSVENMDKTIDRLFNTDEGLYQMQKIHENCIKTKERIINLY